MKISLNILAFYIALLACFPCQDISASFAYEVCTDAGIVHNDSDHSDPAHDLCSPLCICSCCASVNMPPMIFGFAFTAPLPPVSEKSFEYTASFDQTDVNLIWQPPRPA